MDFERYCKPCGSKVKEVYDVPNERRFKCECKNDPLTYKDTIAGYTKDARVTQLRAMHDLMCEANDEYIYMTWIYLMPDCPSEEDFIDIALSDEQYNECFDLFVKLIAKDGNRY